MKMWAVLIGAISNTEAHRENYRNNDRNIRTYQSSQYQPSYGTYGNNNRNRYDQNRNRYDHNRFDRDRDNWSGGYYTRNGMYSGFGYQSCYDKSMKKYHDGHELEFGCHDGKCWAYCGASWSSGEWCETSMYGNYGQPGKCKSNCDCINQVNHCVGPCTVFD